jgi:hypothetical protein
MRVACLRQSMGASSGDEPQIGLAREDLGAARFIPAAGVRASGAAARPDGTAHPDWPLHPRPGLQRTAAHLSWPAGPYSRTGRRLLRRHSRSPP